MAKEDGDGCDEVASGATWMEPDPFTSPDHDCWARVLNAQHHVGIAIFRSCASIALLLLLLHTSPARHVARASRRRRRRRRRF